MAADARDRSLPLGCLPQVLWQAQVRSENRLQGCSKAVPPTNAALGKRGGGAEGWCEVWLLGSLRIFRTSSHEACRGAAARPAPHQSWRTCANDPLFSLPQHSPRRNHSVTCFCLPWGANDWIAPWGETMIQAIPCSTIFARRVIQSLQQNHLAVCL